MDRKDVQIRRKFGITAESSDPTAEVREDEVTPSPMEGEPKEQTADFSENVNEMEEVVLISRLWVTDELAVSYHIDIKPNYPPTPRISIEKKVGKRPDGRPKWIHIDIYDENSLEDLKTGLDKMLEIAMLPSRYLKMEINSEGLLKLQEDGTMEEVHRYVSQIP